MSATVSATVASSLSHFTASPTPFHNVANLKSLLSAGGFSEISEQDTWTGRVVAGGKYYYSRNTSTIVAFVVGGSYAAANPGGFKIVGGHTDSPNIRIKPHSKRGAGAGGATQLNVEAYGGGLWHTWFDRDLSVAGRVLVRSADGKTITQQLVNLERPLLSIPNLCIHLQTGAEREAFKFNKEDHLQPILALADETLSAASTAASTAGTSAGTSPFTNNHEPMLLQEVAKKLGIDVSQIADFELSLYDTQGASLSGVNSEFLNSARLDNQATCITSTLALVEYSKNDAAVAADSDISLIALFDHEEVGSASQNGAGSPIMGEAVRRISSALNGGGGNEDFFQTTLRKSFVVSCDQAHAVHPNYAHKHDKNHAPKMNGGVVIKNNANQRYTTNSFTGFIIREIGRKAGVPTQEFVVRNDCPCGSTIGPIISEKTGMRCMDVGMPQLAMHSCREVMGTKDLDYAVELFKAFWETFRSLDEMTFDCE
jgi:aspartyl aminopeptidase